MAEQEKEDYEQTIMIAKKEAWKYVFAIMKSIQPSNYEEYGEIKVQVAEVNMQTAEYVMALFKNLGILEETNRKKRKISVPKTDGTSYPLEIIEITLKKPPKFRH